MGFRPEGISCYALEYDSGDGLFIDKGRKLRKVALLGARMAWRMLGVREVGAPGISAPALDERFCLQLEPWPATFGSAFGSRPARSCDIPGFCGLRQPLPRAAR